ncbi:hypothetical protein [Kitasatospora sp. NPDC101183]|uniref:hypothetical protein n=1 Tax=Kitasatospora sp. NPDC101183 TaxID=3364100 RepID=UPI003822099B
MPGMLPEELSALTVAAATGIVQAAGTDLWSAVRERVARLWRRGRSGAEQEERAELAARERLDETGRELAAAEGAPAAAERWRDRWTDRLQVFLGDLPAEEQAEAVRELRALLTLAEEGREPAPGVQASDGGVAAGRDVHNSGVIARDVEGGIVFGGTDRPTPPGPAPR